MALPDLTGLNIEDTYQRILQTDGVNIYDGTGSLVNIAATGPFATTGSNTFTGTQTINGNVNINGTASIAYLNVAIESASIIYSSGSNQFGDAANDTQTLFGNIIVPTGSLTVNGNISASGDLFINNGANQIRIGDNIDDNISSDTFKIYNSGTKGFVSTYFYSSTLELKAGASGSSFVNNWSKIEIADNFSSNGYIRLFTSGSERVRIANTGNVGIKTTSPSASLHISGASAEVLLRVDSPASSSILHVSGSGNVGINTSTPRTTTEIVGTLRITNTSNSSRFNDLATDANGYISLQSLVYQSGIGSNSGFVNLFPNYINVGSGSGYFFTSTANSGAGTRDVGFSRAGVNLVSVNSGAEGNANGSLVALNLGAGIGTAPPAARLQVRGSGTTSATTAMRVENTNATASLVVLDDGNVGVGTSSPDFKLHVVNNEAAHVGLFIGNIRPYGFAQGAWGSALYLGKEENGSNQAMASIIGAPTSEINSLQGYLAFGTRNAGTISTRMYITDLGNVGIGTTTPSASLDVSGSGRFTNGLDVTGSIDVSGSITVNKTNIQSLMIAYSIALG
jgi:hypothetical protein